MGDVVAFPPRARPRLHAREPFNPAGEVYRWKNRDGQWVVDWMSNSGDSACSLAGFETAEEADAYIARWRREHPEPSPAGAAHAIERQMREIWRADVLKET